MKKRNYRVIKVYVLLTHNLKVVGSNPTPATIKALLPFPEVRAAALFWVKAKIVARASAKTTSGFPAKFFRCNRNLYPLACRDFRTAIPGLVFY